MSTKEFEIKNERLLEFEQRIKESHENGSINPLIQQLAIKEAFNVGQRPRFRAAKHPDFFLSRAKKAEFAYNEIQAAARNKVVLDVGLDTASEASKIVIGIAAGAVLVGATPLIVVSAVALTAATVVASDSVFEALEDSLDEYFEEAIAISSKKYIDNGGDIEALEPLDSKTKLAAINAGVLLNENSNFQDLDVDQLDELSETMIRVYEASGSKSLREMAGSLAADLDTDSRIAVLKIKTSDIIGPMLAFDKRIADELETLQNTVSTISSDLAQTTNLALNNKDKIGALASILMPGFSLSQKKAMISAGLIDLSREEKELTLEAINNQIEHKEMLETTAKVVQEAQAFVSIMDDLDIDPGPVREIVNFGAAAFSAYISFQSGNILTGVSAITGLFGGGGGGPHPAVMAELRKIVRKLDEIDRKLDKVLENQKILFEQMIQLGERVEEVYAGLLESSIINRALLMTEDKDKLSNLESAIADLYSSKNVYVSSRMGQYADYQAIKWLSSSSITEDIWDPFIALALDSASVSDKLLVSANIEVTNHVELKSLDEDFKKIVKLLEMFESEGEDTFYPHNLSVGMANSTDRVQGVQDKLSQLTNTSYSAPNTAAVLRLPERLKRLIHVSYFGRISENLLNFHYIRACFKNETGEMYSPEELLEGNMSRIGMTWLKRAIEIADVAIAQQTLISGDTLLAKVDQLFSAAITSPPIQLESEPQIKHDLRNKVIEVLKSRNGSTFRKNLGVYLVCSRLWKSAGSHASIHYEYEQAFRDPSAKYSNMHELLFTSPPGSLNGRVKWEIIKSAKGTPELRVDDELSIPFPNPARVSLHSVWQLHSTPAHDYLVELREQLTSHLSLYNTEWLPNTIDSETYASMVTLGAFSQRNKYEQ